MLFVALHSILTVPAFWYNHAWYGLAEVVFVFGCMSGPVPGDSTCAVDTCTSFDSCVMFIVPNLLICSRVVFFSWVSHDLITVVLLRETCSFYVVIASSVISSKKIASWISSISLASSISMSNSVVLLPSGPAWSSWWLSLVFSRSAFAPSEIWALAITWIFFWIC